MQNYIILDGIIDEPGDSRFFVNAPVFVMEQFLSDVIVNLRGSVAIIADSMHACEKELPPGIAFFIFGDDYDDVLIPNPSLPENASIITSVPDDSEINSMIVTETPVVIDSPDYIKIIRNILGRGISKNNVFLNYSKVFQNKSYLTSESQTVNEVKLETIVYYSSLGKHIYESLDENITHFISLGFAAGDQFRPLSKCGTYAKYRGVDDFDIIVTSRGKTLPSFFGHKGQQLSPTSYMALRWFVLTNQIYDRPNFRVFNGFIAYPGFEGYSDHARFLNMPVGSSRNTSDPLAQIYFNIPLFRHSDPIKYPEPLIKPDDADNFRSSVLLNPYGNHVKQIDSDNVGNYMALFEKIAYSLSRKGIRCYTNSMGPEQPPVVGTQVLNGSLYDVLSVCRQFKMIISVFTGFMEAMLLTSANICVLSPTEKFSRRGVAKSFGHENYWEVCIRNHSETVSEIVDIVTSAELPDNQECDSEACLVTYYTPTYRSYIDLCEKEPKWRRRLAKDLFVGLNDDEIADEINGLRSLSKNSGTARFFLASYLVSIGGDCSDELIELVSQCSSSDEIWILTEFVSMIKKRDDVQPSIKFNLDLILAERGDAASMASVSRRYLRGDGTSIDLLKSADWMRRANGIDESYSIELFDILFKLNDQNLLPEMMSLINSGILHKDASALIRMGRCHLGFPGMAKDCDKAIECFRMAESVREGSATQDLMRALRMSGTPENLSEYSAMMGDSETRRE